MSTDKTAIVQKLFELTAADKWDAVEGYLHRDFQAIVAAAHPYFDVYRGLDGFQRLFRKVFFETYDSFEVEVLEFAEGPTRVVAINEATIKGKKTGRMIKMSLAEVFRFEEGKLLSLTTHYADTKLLTEL